MPDADTPREDPRIELRQLSDVQELRALAHPLRIALLELLGLEGATTATEASKIIGGTPANAAYHLRTLAKHGYVVEADGGVGRERPWRLASLGMSFGDGDGDSDPAMVSAAGAVEEVLADRWSRRAKYFRDHKADYPAEARRVSGTSQFVMYGTVEEIEEAQRTVMMALTGFMDRITDPSLRPEGALAYEFVVTTHPFDLASFAPDAHAEPSDSDGGPAAE